MSPTPLTTLGHVDFWFWSRILDWPSTHYVAKDASELWILLPPLGSGIDPRISCMLGKHFTKSYISSSILYLFLKYHFLLWLYKLCQMGKHMYIFVCSYSQGSPWTLSLLHLSHKCWDYKHVPLSLALAMYIYGRKVLFGKTAGTQVAPGVRGVTGRVGL